METSELLKKVRKIEIKAKGLSNHIFSGEYHSAFKGRGMSFSEVRNYQYGDDIRNIDWNVTARTNEPHVKVFEEERELTIMLLIDLSQSAYFGTSQQMKNALITEICAVLAFSAINNNDKVGVLFFTSQPEKYIPPKKGRQHILRIIRELLAFEPQHQGTDLGSAIRYFSNLIKKRSTTFILSDFLTEGYEAPLTVAARRHDIIGLHISDPREQALPNIGLIHATDPETNQSAWLDTSNATVRQRYTQWYQDNLQYFKNTFLKTRTDTISLQTNEPYVNNLLKFFKKRAS